MSVSDLAEKIARLKRFLEQDENNLNLLLDLGRALHESGQPEDAVSLFDRALKIAADHPQAIYERSMVMITLGRVEEAVAGFSQLKTAGLSHPSISYNLGYCYLLQSAPDKAVVELSEHIEEPAKNSGYALVLARAYYAMGDLPEVERFVNLALSLQPDFLEAKAVLAMCLQDNEDFDKAIGMAEEVLAQDPDNAEALGVKAYCSLNVLDLSTAAQSFDAMIQAKPKSGRGWVGKGLLEMQQGDLAAAEGALKKGLENMPGHIGSWNVLAWCQILQGRMQEAEESLGRASEIDDRFGETYGALAVIKALTQDYAEARLLARKATRLDKDSFSGHFARALCDQGENNPEQAQQIMHRLMNAPIDDKGRKLIDILPQFIRH
ncbi:tetratricopeptide repeat protein [Hahella sp. HN01]|uniref:tetratricopeptide repeat protein n=1 Tax=Hahella sp. HN01 TaxID=2847262 RepID=UPI001C1EACA7|nr:tetratricopeptide repeat protein [Hahella sp. HN01]MBU6955242.1 tetratricopeptide repeat protein [Hahella sp. HN01]